MREQNAVFCSLSLSRVNGRGSIFFADERRNFAMTPTLFDKTGNRKYLVAQERLAFVGAALREDALVASFCVTLAITGARISEALALSSERIDRGNEVIVFETLKQRRRGVFRAVPVPPKLIKLVECTHDLSEQSKKLWPWGRTTAWKIVKDVMGAADVPDNFAMPKSLRHSFAVEAIQNGVPLNIVQRWLGHARLETTAIYAEVLGEEERCLARRAWNSLDSIML